MARLLLAIVLAIAAQACVQSGAPSVREPDVAGVIESRQEGANYLWNVSLEDGRTLSLRVKGSQGDGYQPIGLPATPMTGDLVLAGSRPSPWYTTAAHLDLGRPGKPRECYLLEGSGAEHPDFLDFDFGLRVQKAPDFEAAGANGHDFKGGACLDAHGRVKSVGYGGN